MNILVTGGAGFIASNLIAALLRENNYVVSVDNLELGKKENLNKFADNPNFVFYETDVTDEERLIEIARKEKIEFIYHLAANSDIQKSAKDPNIDIKNTLMTTKAVLECMRICNIKKMFFASTSAVYGDKRDEILDEQTGELSPISYYGACKLASESLISAYTYMNDLGVLVFRFPNVIGPNLTHGVIFDFIKKLRNNSKELEILGDGTQCKPYIYVQDLVDCMLLMSKKLEKGVQLYNVGVPSATTVTRIADIICEKMNLSEVAYKYTGGNVGWKGDVPRFKYSMDKIYAEGWKAQLDSDEAVAKTVEIFLSEEA